MKKINITTIVALLLIIISLCGCIENSVNTNEKKFDFPTVINGDIDKLQLLNYNIEIDNNSGIFTITGKVKNIIDENIMEARIYVSFRYSDNSFFKYNFERSNYGDWTDYLYNIPHLEILKYNGELSNEETFEINCYYEGWPTKEDIAQVEFDITVYEEY